MATITFEEQGVAVAFYEDDTVTVISTSDTGVSTTVTNLQVGPQGPAGPAGADGANIEIGSSAPSSPDEGDLWLNSTSNELSVYANASWKVMTYKSDLSNETGSLSINAGYF